MVEGGKLFVWQNDIYDVCLLVHQRVLVGVLSSYYFLRIALVKHGDWRLASAPGPVVDADTSLFRVRFYALVHVFQVSVP